MKLALIGYGKMGHEIEQIALLRGHELVLIIDQRNQQDLNETNLKKADVAIEFSNPESAVENYRKCFESGIPVVSGTTGWLEQMPGVIAECEHQHSGFFYASNFSLGVNLFFELNRKLARMMKGMTEYQVQITEIHHVHKLDAPSGTAITLAEGIIDENPMFSSWGDETGNQTGQIPIHSVREGEVPGTHQISYDSAVDTLTIQHEAKSRKGFALGAVLAAEFMIGKTGIYSMHDLLNISGD